MEAENETKSQVTKSRDICVAVRYLFPVVSVWTAARNGMLF